MEPTSYLSIIDTLQGVFNSADKRDWKQCAAYFAGEVFVDFGPDYTFGLFALLVCKLYS